LPFCGTLRRNGIHSTDGYKIGTPNKAKYRTICTATRSSLRRFPEFRKARAPLRVPLDRPGRPIRPSSCLSIAERSPCHPAPGWGPPSMITISSTSSTSRTPNGRPAGTLSLTRRSAPPEDRRIKLRPDAPGHRSGVDPGGKALHRKPREIRGRDWRPLRQGQGRGDKKLTAYVADAFAKSTALYDRLLTQYPGTILSRTALDKSGRTPIVPVREGLMNNLAYTSQNPEKIVPKIEEILRKDLGVDAPISPGSATLRRARPASARCCMTRRRPFGGREACCSPSFSRSLAAARPIDGPSGPSGVGCHVGTIIFSTRLAKPAPAKSLWKRPRRSAPPNSRARPRQPPS